jgi:hypothetical protein
MTDQPINRRKLLTALGIGGVGVLSYAAYSGRSRNTDPESSGSGENAESETDGSSPYVADVRAYGAAVDGRTNDAEAIQEAADDVAPDGVVALPPGDLLIDTPEDERGAITLGTAHRNVSFIGTGGTGSETTLRMAPGKTSVHYAFHVAPGSMSPDDTIELSNLSIDLNAPEQDGVGTGIRTNGADGTFRMRNCSIRSTRNGGLRMVGGMDGDIRYCSFEDNGVEASAHAISTNQADRETTTLIRHVFCANQQGVSIDVGVGADERTDLQTVVIDRCVLRDSFGGVKVNPTAAVVTVRNTKLVGMAEIPVKMNPYGVYVGEVVLDNVLIDGGGWPGVDFPNAARLTLRDVAIMNVDKDDTARGRSRGGIRTGDLDFGSSGRVSVHNVGADNDGPALKIFDGAGSIQEVIHGGTGGLGRTEGVTVETETSGDPLEPTVPDRDAVGLRRHG